MAFAGAPDGVAQNSNLRPQYVPKVDFDPGKPSVIDINACLGRYTREARMQEAQGTVHFKVQVSKEGKFVSAALLQSSGFKVLDDITLAAFSTCRFRPAKRDGLLVDGELELVEVWSLEG